MAVPRTRTSNSRKNTRRSHHAKGPQNLTACPNCAKLRQSHRVCTHCGHYRGKSVMKKDED